MAMKSPLSLLAIAAATALMLTACGSAGDDTTSGGSGGTSGGSGGTSGGSGGTCNGGAAPADPCPSLTAMSTTQPVTDEEKSCILQAHNAARDDVIPAASSALNPLEWDDGLATIAYNYSQQLANGGCSLVHSGSGYGENLWGGSGPSFTVTHAVNSWVGERQQFCYGTDSSSWGHYTQIVYAPATKVGCGYAVCNGGGVIMTCNYDRIQPNFSTPYPIP